MTATQAAVRWGFVGAGGIATKALGPAVRAATNAELHAVAARDADRARGFADTFGSPATRAFGSYQELLDDPGVEVVYISLPNDAHLPWTLAALAAGKHVLCEKPLGLTAAQVARMQAAATAADRLLVEAWRYRWHPRTQAAELLLADGAIGPVVRVEAAFTFEGVAPDNYRWELGRGGGALYDVGCYPVSTAVWAFNDEPLGVDATFVRAPSGVDTAADLTVTFGRGEARLYGAFTEPKRQHLVITGERGTLHFSDPAITTAVGAESELVVTIDGHVDRIPFPAVDAYQLMVEAVSRAVRGEDVWLVPLEQSLRIAHIIDEAFRSGC